MKLRNKCSECGRMNKEEAITCCNCHAFLREPFFKALLWDSLTEQKSPGLFKLWAELYESDGITSMCSLSKHDITEKQEEMLKSLKRNNAYTCVLGSRKTGKSYIAALAIAELGIRKKISVKILSAKKETASNVVWQVGEIVPANFLKNQSREKIKFKNGTTIDTLANTVAGTGTFEADILLIDEAQEIDDMIWDKVLPMLLTGRDMRLWIVGTAKAGSRFQEFWQNKNDKYDFFEMRMEDAEWVSKEDWDAIAGDMSERMRRQELELEWVEPEGSYFNSKGVEHAFSGQQVSQHEIYVASWDWGVGHQTVGFLFGVASDGSMEELECFHEYNPSPDEIKGKFAFWHEKYRPMFIMEGSPLGGFIRQELTKHYRCKVSNFATNKDKFWLALEIMLDKKKLALKTHQLKQELLVYDGNKKNDDHVDALLHGVKYVYDKYMGGSNVAYRG